MKKLGLILLAAVLVLAGCGGPPVTTQNISGHGSVELEQVIIGFDESEDPIFGQIGEANFSLSFACYAQNNNRMVGSLTWYDPANGVRISATLPETTVKVFTSGQFTTCKAMKAAASTLGFSVAVAGIYSEDGNANGNAGTLKGLVKIFVTQPGGSIGGGQPCGEMGTAVGVAEYTPANDFVYAAGGCLDRGKIIFGGGGQNQQ